MSWSRRYIMALRRLTAGRLAKGMSQADMGLRLGVSERTVRRIENGEADISARALFKWADIVKVDIVERTEMSEGK